MSVNPAKSITTLLAAKFKSRYLVDLLNDSKVLDKHAASLSSPAIISPFLFFQEADICELDIHQPDICR